MILSRGRKQSLLTHEKQTFKFSISIGQAMGVICFTCETSCFRRYFSVCYILLQSTLKEMFQQQINGQQTFYS